MTLSHFRLDLKSGAPPKAGVDCDGELGSARRRFAGGTSRESLPEKWLNDG